VSPRRVLRLALPLLAATACIVGCGGSKSGANAEKATTVKATTVPIEGVGDAIGGSVAPLAQCRDWQAGSVEERFATIEDIRGQLTPQTSPSERSGFPDQEAYDLFQRVCARPYASAFRLYKVYANRAGFQALEP
jgi:hypothetical protein